MEIFIVTSGDYDAYHIEAVFSTQENADNYMEAFYGGKARSAEKWEVDSILVPEGELPYAVTLSKEGNHLGTRLGKDKGDHFENQIAAFVFANKPQASINIIATSAAQAITKANEIRKKILKAGWKSGIHYQKDL